MKKLTLVIIVLSLISCETTVTRENNPDDIKRASTLVEKYYNAYKEHDFTKASSFAGADFTQDEFAGVIKKVDSLWGNINKCELVWGHSFVKMRNGVIVESEYQLKYENQYDKSLKTEETFGLKIWDDTLVITAFHAAQQL